MSICREERDRLHLVEAVWLLVTGRAGGRGNVLFPRIYRFGFTSSINSVIIQRLDSLVDKGISGWEDLGEDDVEEEGNEERGQPGRSVKVRVVASVDIRVDRVNQSRKVDGD